MIKKVMIIIIIVLGWFIYNLASMTLCQTRNEGIYNHGLHIKQNIENLKNDILRYPTTEEGLLFLCKNVSNLKGWKGSYDDDFCEFNKNEKYVYKNLDGVVVFYHKGQNEKDEYGFGDDIREEITTLEYRKAKNLKIILFNSIYLSFFLGVIFTMVALKRVKKEED
ncbi:MAG: type II secretion system protein GspG [Sulfurovum sp.]